MTQHSQIRRSNRMRGFATFVAVAFVASSALALPTGPGVPGVPSPGRYRTGNNNNKNNNNKNTNNQTPAAQQPSEPTKPDMSALDQAKKDASAAKVEQQKAQAAVAQARAKLMKGFDSKPEVIEAKKKVEEARSAYDAAATPVLKSL
jgi:hypothetical protein